MAFSPKITADEFTDFEDEFQDIDEPVSLKKTSPLKQQLSFENEFTDLSDEFEDVEEPATIGKQPTNQINIPEKRPYATPYDVPELTPEQLKGMSVSDRLQYARDLATEREYRQSRGFTKGALSGLSFGLSEKIPGLAPEEGDFLVGFGEFLGSALPISKLYNVLGKPLVTLASKSPIMAQGLQSIARMTGFGLTGAAYEGAKETIKTGEVPSAEELAKYGATWAAFDGALQALGKAASFLPKLKSFASSSKISEKEALNRVVENLEAEGINIAENPEAAVSRAEQLLSSSRENELSKALAEADRKVLEARQRMMSLPERNDIRWNAVEEYDADQKLAQALDEQQKILARQKSIESEQTTPQLQENGVDEFRDLLGESSTEEIEPLIERTEEGAVERIEYPKTGVDKIIDKMNEFIQAARTPTESLKRLGQKTNKNIFNALAPLERLETEISIPERVTTRIKFAQSAASEINSVLENGIFSNITGNFEHEGLKGAYGDLTWKKLSKGLKEGEYSLQDLDAYRTSKIALKRQAEGKKTGVDTRKAKEDIGRLAKKYEVVDKRIRDFQKATIKHYGKDLLGEELIEKWNKDYYSPLYRVMETGKDSVLKSGSLTPKQPFKKMKGSERKIVPPSESDPYNASMLISNARKNEAILQYRKLVLEGKLPGKIKSAKNDPIPAEVLEDLDIDAGLKNVNVFSSINPQDRSALAKFFGATNRLFSRGISLAPRKFGSIFGRDALSSLVYSRTGSNPISIAEALSDIYNAKPVYKEFLSMGGDVYASRLAERIDRAKKIEDLITPGKEGILVPFEKMGDYFRKYSEALGDISLAVPLGEYKRALAKYGNTAEGRIMAAMEARRVTYDPTRKGAAKIVRELGNYIPFWNVSLQDMAMLGRNLKSPEAWAKGAVAITLPTILLKMTNEGNPDYEDLTPVDKAAFWHVYFGDKHIRIPIPWLLGTAFKVGAEAFYETTMELAGKGDQRAKEAWKGLYYNFVENLSGDLPPLLQNYMELTTGKSVPSPLGLILGTESRAPEVIPRRLQDLPPELQYTAKTSQLARWFGNLWGVSPAKLERTIKNFGTQVASDLLALTDEIAYFTGLAEDIRPEQKESNYLLLGNFVSNSPLARTKYANEFYEYLREATQNKNAQKLILEKGITDIDLDQVDYADVPIFAYNRSISKLFKAMRSIEDDKALSPPQKKKELDHFQREINDLYKKAVMEIKKAKSR